MYKPEGMCGIRTDYSKKDIERAYYNQDIIEGFVEKCDKDCNLYIKLNDGYYGIIPKNETGITSSGDSLKSSAIISKVGTMVCFKVKDLDTTINSKNYVLLSRREAQLDCRDKYISKLKVGQVLDVMVSHIEDYGIFCDLACGYLALLPIKNICVTRVYNIKDTLKDLKRLKVIIKSIDDWRITLSHKELLGTWEEEVSKFSVGDIVIGEVETIKDNGTFIRLTPNLSGLTDDVVNMSQGNLVRVYIKSINSKKMKVRVNVIDRVDGIEDNSVLKFEYRISDGILDKWVYSPKESNKDIKTVFREQ